MSDLYTNDDFEKVEPESDAYQDENITSTSMSGGDMAEEDEYVSGNSAQNDLDMFAAAVTETIAPTSTGPKTPLISFDQPLEPTAPTPPVFSDSVSGVKAERSEGLMAVPGVKTLCCWVKNVDPRVLDLIYWRDVKKTGVVFGSMLFILLSLSICSLMSVLAYLSLAILTVTLSFRIYKNVMQAVQKTNEGHPFKNLLQMDIELNEDVVKNAADKIAGNINNCVKELRRLYLVEDYVDTLKFGLLLWLLTYIGGWFNGMTLIILTVVSIFTLPKVYETYKVPIDQNVNLVRGNLNNIMAQVSAKIPFPKKKAKVN